VTAYLAALKAVATAATEAVHDATRRNGRSCPAYLLVLERALATLRALPEGEEEALKPGEEATCCRETANGGRSNLLVRVTDDGVDVVRQIAVVASTDGILHYTDEMRVEPTEGVSLSHAQVAELCAVLARVRVK